MSSSSICPLTCSLLAPSLLAPADAFWTTVFSAAIWPSRLLKNLSLRMQMTQRSGPFERRAPEVLCMGTTFHEISPLIFRRTFFKEARCLLGVAVCDAYYCVMKFLLRSTIFPFGSGPKQIWLVQGLASLCPKTHEAVSPVKTTSINAVCAFHHPVPLDVMFASHPPRSMNGWGRGYDSRPVFWLDQTFEIR